MLKVIEGENKGNAERAYCKVCIGDKVQKFDDFIIVGYDMKTGKATTAANADIITAAIAMESVKEYFEKLYSELSETERKAFDACISKVLKEGEVE